MTRAELKALAKEQISGKIGTLFLITLLSGLIGGGLNCIPMVGSIASLIVTPMINLSVIAIYLGIVDGKQPQVSDMFCKMDSVWKALCLNLLTVLFVYLWSLLLIVPGIVKALSYSMSPYILAENPNLTAKEALDASKQMMNGHKMELFVLGLSFIGWILLSTITFGIALIWVMPYMNATMANFYRSIRDGGYVSE